MLFLTLLLGVYCTSCTKIPQEDTLSEQEKTEETASNTTNEEATDTNMDENTNNVDADANADAKTEITLKGKCRFADRKTVQIIENKEAVIGKLSQFLILTPINKEEREGTRYFVCPDVPDLKVGDKVLFSAEVKEIRPTERLMATPIVLTAIKK